MWTGNSESIAPTKLKKKIGEFATQFSGYGQQDSQEFISYLIDGLQEDLNLVKKKETFEISDDIKPDEEMSRERELNDSRRIQSFIRNLMVGQFKSTVVCSACNKTSVCFDPFMLITLPIPTRKESNFYFVSSLIDRGAIKIGFDYSSMTTLRSIAQEFTKTYNDNYYAEIRDGTREKLHEERMLFLTLDQEKFSITNVHEPDDKISSINVSNIIFFVQIPVVKKDEELMLCEFEYAGERSSYPRFLKYNKAEGKEGRENVIYKSLERGLENRAKSSYE
jgi:hypothetical protein